MAFNHLALPDENLAALEQTFFGQPGAAENPDPLRSPSATPRQARALDPQSHTTSVALTLHITVRPKQSV